MSPHWSDQCTCACHRGCTCHLQTYETPLILKTDPSIILRKPIIITLPRAPSDLSSASYATYSSPNSSPSAPRHVHFDKPATKHQTLQLPYSPQAQPRSILRSLSTPSTPPSIPTIYIITFAKSLTPSSQVSTLLSAHIPSRKPPIPHLQTIDASTLPVPPIALCEQYSGISPIMQDVVCSHGRARQWISRAVRALIDSGTRQDGRVDLARDGYIVRREVAMSVCCESGTHRSVAIAERIAQGVKEEVGRSGNGKGVKIVCRHVHRMKGPRDPF